MIIIQTIKMNDHHHNQKEDIDVAKTMRNNADKIRKVTQ